MRIASFSGRVSLAASADAGSGDVSATAREVAVAGSEEGVWDGGNMALERRWERE